MGAVTSTNRSRNISLKVTSKKGKKHCKGPNSRGRTKRSSVNRPVLQLQVKPATLERVRQRLTSTSGPHLVTRKTLHSLARNSGMFDTLITRSRTCSNGSHHSNHTLHPRTCSVGSHDSLIMLELVKNEHGINGKDVGDNSDNYDHVNIEFGHLRDCTFGHISLVAEVEDEDDEGSDCTYGRFSLVTEVDEEEGCTDEEKSREGEGDDHMADIPCQTS